AGRLQRVDQVERDTARCFNFGSTAGDFGCQSLDFRQQTLGIRARAIVVMRARVGEMIVNAVNNHDKPREMFSRATKTFSRCTSAVGCGCVRGLPGTGRYLSARSR